MRAFHKLHNLPHPRCSPSAPQNVDKDSWSSLRARIPTNLKGLLSFIGSCNVFRWFIPIFTGVGPLLNEELQKGQLQAFDKLSDDETTTLQRLKVWLMEHPVLVLPRSQGSYTVYNDAYDRAIGSVLLQKRPGGRYWSIWYLYCSLNES